VISSANCICNLEAGAKFFATSGGGQVGAIASRVQVSRNFS
jgi:hypothetical protein